MTDFIKILFSLSVSGTCMVMLLLLLKPLYKSRMSQKWQYYIWLLVIVRLLLPVTIDFNIMENVYKQVSSEAVHLKRESNITLEKGKTDSLNISSMNGSGKAENQNNTQSTDTKNEHPVKKRIEQLFLLIRNNTFYVWLVIALISFTRKITVYQEFRKYLKLGCTEVNSLSLWEELGHLLEESHIKANVRIYRNNQVSSPLLTGFFSPCIILPSEELGKTEFKNIISHELTHFKRRDMFYKWLVQITICVHWFNPFVYLIARETDRLSELSCDEAIIRKMDYQRKREYGNTLLNMAATNKTLKNSIASVTLIEGKNLLKERLERIMKFNKKTMFCTIATGVLTLTLCVTAAAMGNANLKESDDKVQKIQEEKESADKAQTVQEEKKSDNKVQLVQLDPQKRKVQLVQLDPQKEIPSSYYEYPEEWIDFDVETFGTDRKAIMSAIKAGKPEVEEAERYGDNPECMESCEAKSNLFHLDIFDKEEEYQQESDGTYMVRVYFDGYKLLEEKGKREALQLLQTIYEALNIPYEEDALWGYLEETIKGKGSFIQDRGRAEYKEYISVSAGLLEGKLDISEIRFDLRANPSVW